jgi:hypothetical protein
MCDNLSFADCELAVLRNAVDNIEKTVGKKLVKSPNTHRIIQTVERFIRHKKCIIYGGTAINNILPEKDQFYNYDYELPDYDFYSTTPMEMAKELADIYAKHGYQVEAKAGVHIGTYKVFVSGIGVADITLLHPELYHMLRKRVIIKGGLMYAPANFLRQSMYNELSRPLGDVSRWEKVLKRLNALNKHYPLVYKKCHVQRRMSSREHENHLFNTIKNFLVHQNVVFIGGYANALYTNYTRVPKVENLPDFDVLVNDPKPTAYKLAALLQKYKYTVTVNEHKAIGELISTHYSVSVDGEYVAFLYEPVACHSYNEIQDGSHKIKIGTIDTLLSYYLAFMYADRDYFDENRLLCLSSTLFKVQQENRLTQKDILKRFTIQCYGVQPTLQSAREERVHLYETLDHDSTEFKRVFFKYVPNVKHTRKNKLKRNEHV